MQLGRVGLWGVHTDQHEDGRSLAQQAQHVRVDFSDDSAVQTLENRRKLVSVLERQDHFVLDEIDLMPPVVDDRGHLALTGVVDERDRLRVWLHGGIDFERRFRSLAGLTTAAAGCERDGASEDE